MSSLRCTELPSELGGYPLNWDEDSVSMVCSLGVVDVSDFSGGSP